MPDTLTADDLLPEVKAYLAAIAAEHGEPAPEFDEDAMRDVLEGLLENPDQPEPEVGQLFSRPGPAEQYARTKHAKTGQAGLWDESEHPRAADGEFTAGSGGGKGEKAAHETEKPAKGEEEPARDPDHVTDLKLKFDADIQHFDESDTVSGATVSVLDESGKERGHATFALDNMATVPASRPYFDGVDKKALKQGVYRMSGIEVKGSLMGKGIGGELYLRAFNAVGDRPYFYNSQTSRSALKSLGKLASAGLIELHQNPRDAEQHFARITEKGQQHLAELDEKRKTADYPDLKPAASKQGSEGEKPAKAATAETPEKPGETETASESEDEPEAKAKHRPASWPEGAGPQNLGDVAGKNYEKVVAANLHQMSAPAHEWGAVPVKGMTETTNDRGDSVSMPEFDFPQGYDHAPSVFHDQDGCCNLCGHDIKNVFWIQNDEKKWVMPVGSECVSNFGEGHSGAKAAKQSIAEANRDTVRQLEDARRAIRLKHTHETPNRVMSGGSWFTSGTKRVWNNDEKGRAAKELHDQIAKALGDVSAKVGAHNVRTGKYDPEEPVWTDRQIANWIKKNGETAGKLLKDADKHLPKPPPAKKDEDDAPV